MTRPAVKHEPTPAQKKIEAKNFETCRAKLKKAKTLDVLYDLKSTMPPTVIAGPTYSEIPYDAKEGFAETVNCFLMAGSSDGGYKFDILDYRTHRVLDTWSYNHLEPAEQ